MMLSTPLIAEFEALNSAKLAPDQYLAASTALAARHFLLQMSQLLGKPIEAITASDIIAQFKVPPIGH